MVFKCQENSYLTEFASTVVRCEPTEFNAKINNVDAPVKGYEVVLEDTIIFPEGGGQPCDHGFLNEKPVLNVVRKGAIAIHYVQSEDSFNVGDVVQQKVDWDRRFDHMQQHSGQHLITAIFEQDFGFATTTWNLGSDTSFIELETSNVTPDQLQKAEQRINKFIADQTNVSVVRVSGDEKEIPPEVTRATRGLPKDHVGDIRVVTFDGIESNMCCGTHVKNLAELQVVKLLNVEKCKARVLVHFVVGNRVLKKGKLWCSTEEFKHELTCQENDQILELAERLAGTRKSLIDTCEWIQSAHTETSSLPRRVISILRRFRNDPGSDGALLLRNLPVVGMTPLPPTPCVPNSVESVASVSSSVTTAVMLQLAEVIAFRNEKNGALVQNVVPVLGQETQQSNAGSVLLEFHVENAFHDNRPDYIGLLCIREDSTGEAKFCTSSIRRALPLLSAKTIDVLATPQFLTKPPPSFGLTVSKQLPHPVLVGDLDDPNILVDFAATEPLNEFAKEALLELREAFIKTMITYQLRVGDMAIVDNRVAVHGRTSFVPRYDGTDRWLQRVYGHLDNRRSRVDRKYGGFVIN